MLRLWSRWWFARNAFIVLLLLVAASCSGAGGCSSGCSSCGVKPLAAGFPRPELVEAAAQVRLTRPGLDFLQTNAPALASKLLGSPNGVLTFQIPTTSTSSTGFTIHVCPNGPNPNSDPPQCIAEIEVGKANLTVDSLSPDGAINVAGTIPIRVRDLPAHADGPLGISFDIGIGVGDGSCNGGTPNVDYHAFPLKVKLPLVAETILPRQGYTKIVVDPNNIDLTVNSGDVQVCSGNAILQVILDLAKGSVISSLVGGVKNTIAQQLQQQLCTKVQPTQNPPCPDGAQPDNADLSKATNCVYTSQPNTCMPMMLGTNGEMDLGRLLASISPGTTGGLDFELAANGAMNPAPGAATDGNGHSTNGVTLGMFGGTKEAPATACVPVVANPPPTGIPVPDEMLGDKITPWPANDPGPHVGIAIAGKFIDHAMTSVYNSGLLCLGVSTEQFQALNSGYLSLVVPSIKKLTFEGKPAATAITTRPQKPPTVKLGGGTDIKTDPLLTVELPQFAIDFYVWSADRFVRIFTFTADVGVPVNLSTAKDPAKNPNGGLLPVIGDLQITNPVVSNSDLLLDDPKTMAASLQGLLGGIVAQFIGGGIKPIDLSSSLKSLGLAMTIPDGGIRKLHKNDDDFLGIFADLALATGPAAAEIDTQAKIESLTVHPEAMALDTADRSKFPTLRLALSSPEDDGTRPIEYAWWIDDGTRSEWTRDRAPVVDSDVMLLQGKHVLHVVARYAGVPSSEDSTPAAVPYIVDTLAPVVSLATNEGGTHVKAWDLVSDDTALVARYRLTRSAGETAAWTEWQPLASVTSVDFANAYGVDVEVKDEVGNVGSASNQLITGRPDPTLAGAGSGCGCSTPGADARGIAWGGSLAVVLGLLALATRRRGARAERASRGFGAGLALAGIAVAASLNEGCACGSDGETTEQTDDGGSGKTGCGSDCNQPCGPANPMGLVGAYTSVAKANDGTIWVAGYNDADLVGGNPWGDLVVGKYDSGKQQIAWTTVDGLPPARTDGTCPPNDPTGWRGGETDPGDDVGLWTSMQLGPGQNPMVSYYDASHRALKFASFDGKKWQSHTVKGGVESDVGRYSKMIVVGGNPVVAFLVMEKGKDGKMRSKVTLAKGNVAVPGGPGDWSFEDAAVDENGPCRATFCDPGQVCVQQTGVCQSTATGCTPNPCPSGGIGSAAQACVTIDGGAQCATVTDATHLDTFPNAFADYVSIANGPQGLGIVLYDRIHGNLVGISKQNGAWTATIFDGETGSRAMGNAIDTGDVGEGASLAIAANGDWHISYGNGFSEAMQYMLVKGGTMPQPVEVVDDGKGVNGMVYPDGQHVVSQDSHISVDQNGVVTIAYQDSTNGTLLVANGSPSGTSHKWAVKAVQQPNKWAGFFPQTVPGTSQLTNWWRSTNRATMDVEANVAFVTP